MKIVSLKILYVLLLLSSGLYAQDVKIDSLAEGKRVIEKYINAIGGKEKLNSIVDRTTVMKMESSGMIMKTIAYQKAPNKKRQEIYTGNVEQVIIFDGEKGTQIISGTDREILGEEFERLKIESIMNFITTLDSLGIKAIYVGQDTLNNEKLEVVKLLFPNGTEWLQFFSVETGLKMKEEKTVSTPTGIFKQIILLSDYKEVEGVKYPFKIKQSLNKHQFVVTVSKIDVNKGLSDKLFEK